MYANLITCTNDEIKITFGNAVTYCYKQGNLHRIGGPAIECKLTNTCKYYINGKQITKEAHDLLVNLMKLRGIETK